MAKAIRCLTAVTLAVSFWMATPIAPASASTATRADEKSFVSKLNGLRKTHGLPAYKVDYRLRTIARTWAAHMADEGFISHNPDLASQLPSDWLRAGENVGVGGNVQALHDAFVASPGHYKNMVSSTFTAVGIGVVHTPDQIWVSVEFMRGSIPTPADPENPTSFTKDWAGYTLVGEDGRIYGASAKIQNASAKLRPAKPIVGTASTPSYKGLWEVGADGGVFSFGDARFYGSAARLRLNRPITGMTATANGHGYWMVAGDGGIFSFGNARFHGSTGGMRLNKPIVGMAATPKGGGYWLVASDGGIFAFGDARFYGSTGGIKLRSPIRAMTASPSGRGYWLVAADGGVFAFGDARFYGSLAGKVGEKAVAGMISSHDGRGYFVATRGGRVYAFGNAKYEGSVKGTPSKPIAAMSR